MFRVGQGNNVNSFIEQLNKDEKNKNSNKKLSEIISSNLKAKLAERDMEASEYKTLLNQKIAIKIDQALRDNDSKKFLDDYNSLMKMRKPDKNVIKIVSRDTEKKYQDISINESKDTSSILKNVSNTKSESNIKITRNNLSLSKTKAKENISDSKIFIRNNSTAKIESDLIK